MQGSFRNLLIGRGERLIVDGEWKGGGGGKPEPYSLGQQQTALHPALTWLAERARAAKPQLAPRGEIAAKITLHPEFLAKTYFPSSLLRECGFRLLGSRETILEPRAMVRGKPVEPRVTATLIVAGDSNSFLMADALLMSAGPELGPRHTELRRLESIELFGPEDRIRVNAAHLDGWLETSLHAALEDRDVREAFTKLVSSVGGVIDQRRFRTVGGLTFSPIYLAPEVARSALQALEDFTHLRVIRNMPFISTDPAAGSVRNLSFSAPPLPAGPAVAPDLRTAIFDGGFPQGVLPWVNSIDAPGVPALATSLDHGTHVTTAFLFGRLDGDEDVLQQPYTNVDHVRVLPSGADDQHVGDVIDRIINHLKNARDEEHSYRFANLSLGPRLPIVDDDPHEWTVRLDDLLSLGDLFLTVAAGNDGEHGPDLGRIQPPADAVNAFTVGACDTFGPRAQRATFSCMGPGRSPGLVKPDVVAFGGDRGKPLAIFSPVTHTIAHTLGTSFSAPLALRLAAGVQARIEDELQPIMLHALLVSRAKFRAATHDQRDVGWGILPESLEELLYSPADEVVVMYQGHIVPGQPLRAPLPLPPGLSTEGKVEIAATFAYRAPIDPAHPVNYTRAGLEIRFQPDGEKSVAFFSKGHYDTEQELRADALKWETCRHRKRSISLDKLSKPSFVIRYQGRDEGQPEHNPTAVTVGADGAPLAAANRPDALPFALVLRLRIPGEIELAQKVLLSFPVLAEVPLRTRVEVPAT